MDAATRWVELFRSWPEDLPRRGVAVTLFGEQITFDGFLYTEQMVLLNRRNPDTVGTRQIILPYDQLSAVKITDIVKTRTYNSMGFKGTLPKH